MKPQWFLKKRKWGCNPEDNTDFFTTWVLVGIMVMAMVFSCQS